MVQIFTICFTGCWQNNIVIVQVIYYANYEFYVALIRETLHVERLFASLGELYKLHFDVLAGWIRMQPKTNEPNKLLLAQVQSVMRRGRLI